MKAWVYYPKQVETKLTERPIPEAGAGEVVVQLKAAALNHRDLYFTKGWKIAENFDPFVLGSDGAGIVYQVGSGVTEWAVGDEVIMSPYVAYENVLGGPTNGTLAEYVSVPQDVLIRKPQHLDFEQAAALPLALGTAWWALAKGQLKAGETVYLQGIGGGVALFALQLAVAKGAKVIVSSGSEAKIQRAIEMGAAAGLNYHDEDFVNKMKDLTEGRGVDLAVDSGGKDTARNTILSLANNGRVVMVGSTSGAADVDLRDLWDRQASLHTVLVCSTPILVDGVHFYEEHQLIPQISQVYPLEQVMDAFAAMKNAEQFGKLVIRM